MKKGEIYEGVIDRVVFPNKGYVQVGDDTVIVKNGIPGQKVRFRINKKKNGRCEAQLLEVLEKSPLETQDALCSLFPACGGCMYRTMDYEAQLEMKKNQVKALLDQAVREGHQVDENGEPDYAFEGIRRSPSENGYRNKMEFAFGDAEKDGPLTLGLHKKGSTYDILPISDCRIVHDDFNKLTSAVQSFARESGWKYYHKNSHIGYLRHLLVRRSAATGEILIDLVTSSQYTDRKERPEEAALEELKNVLLSIATEGHISGILHTVNDSVADVVRSDRTDILYGVDYFYEHILGLKFKITPFSFFQTNSRGAEVLYETAREFLGSVENETVFDLYSGTGTIGQMLAPVCGKVIGVEIVEEAVEAARENAALNGLTNCTFLAGDVLKMLDEIPDKPEAIVLDPPRDGIHPKALPKILAYGVDKMIYISCKPTSLARDLPYFLMSGYRLERAVCVDMFPGTVHCETVCLLSNRKPDSYVHLNLKMEDYYRIKDAEKEQGKK
ncbi:MAG: 23S rRNA (uracil(1939)-C(5))-methyltransferase RlmD [Eubacterium sp.]|nr:23S rRNA (uracil(1939)-C(5))-methyltransferase RlmD [Eubacterium sp.]